MFRSFGRPAWPNPEQSVGAKCERKIDNLDCYEANGRVAEIFDEFAPLIKDLLDAHREDLEKGEQRPRAIAFGVFMIGSEPAQTQPTIVFASLSTLQRKRAKALVVEKKLLADHPNIRMKALSQLPALPRSDHHANCPRHHRKVGSDEQSLQAAEDSVRRPALLTLDGGGVKGLSQLFILESLMKRILDLDRSMTSARSSSVLSSIDHSGGFVQVGKKTFSVAPLHPYLDLGASEEEDAELSGELEFDLDSDDDDLGSEQSNLPIIRSCQSDDDQHTAFNAVADHKRTALLPKHGLDYRIIEVSKEERLYNVINVDSDHSRQITPQTVASKPEERDVIVNTRTTGPVQGRLMRSPRYIKMAGWSNYQEMWVVKMDRDAIPGDCGAWVVEDDDDDSTETKLYGHVVAGLPGSLETYIIPACTMFDDIEAQIGERPKLPTLESSPKAQPHEFFDLVAGTSTGGLIAIMLGRLRMSLNECIDAYRNLGEEVISKPRLASIRGPIPWLRPKFSNLKLERVLHEIVQRRSGLEAPANPALDSQQFCSTSEVCQTLVVARDKYLNTRNPQAFLFRTYSNRMTAHFSDSKSSTGSLLDTGSAARIVSNGSLDVRPEKDVPWTPPSSIASRDSHRGPSIVEVARATTAAPTFFKSIRLLGHSYVDGAVCANNPAKLALEEISHVFEEPLLLVSIGTGRPHNKACQYPEGLYGKLKFFLDPSKKLSADSEDMHKELQDLFANNPRASYYRFNVDTSLADVKLDEWKMGTSTSPGTFDTILQHTKAYLSKEEVRNEIDKAAKLLIEYRQLRLKQDRSHKFTASEEDSRCGVEPKVRSSAHPTTLTGMKQDTLLYQNQGMYETALPLLEARRQPSEKAHSIASTTSGSEPNPYQRLVKLSYNNGSHQCDSLFPVLFDTGSECNFIFRQALDRIGYVQRYPIKFDRLKSYSSPLVGSSGAITPTQFIRVKLHSSEIGLHDDCVKLKIMEGGWGIDIILGRKFIMKIDKNNTGSLLNRLATTPQNAIDSKIMDGQLQEICAIRALREVETSKGMDIYPYDSTNLGPTFLAEQNEIHAAHVERLKALRSLVQTRSPPRAGRVMSGDIPQLPHACAYCEDNTPPPLQADQSEACPAKSQSVKTSNSSVVSSVFSCGGQSTVSSTSSWEVDVTVKAPIAHGVVRGRGCDSRRVDEAPWQH